MQLIFFGLLVVHGLIHSLGFLKAFNIIQVKELTQEISRSLGALWLLAAIAMILAGVGFLFGIQTWWVNAILAIVLSQALIYRSWQDAKWGTIINIIVFVAAILSWGSWRFEQEFRRDVKTRLASIQDSSQDVITPEDLAALPSPVRRYLELVGVVGRPKVQNYRVTLSGRMRSKAREYFRFRSEQYNFTGTPTRLFFMKGQMFGVTVPGYHRYTEQQAIMDIRLFGLISVIRYDGDLITRSDTVTLLNDMCLMAPATLIDKRIAWQEIDELTAKATFTNENITVSATLHFDEEGKLVDFVSDDRWEMEAMRPYRFSTPIHSYQRLGDYNLPAQGEAIWHYPDGPFSYATIDILEVDYNLKSLAR
ncbi:MAG TPA: hypothetical protein PKD64_03005 [Pirellulaceae bacterium]|nr:hypothetical protein [Pirellulaceae bacterium]HMO91138.1 hypothetical protein [Pirellulaceae bacterium]HMP69091.1 hypothetical protein [Pirellulaceae bacterium]